MLSSRSPMEQPSKAMERNSLVKVLYVKFSSSNNEIKLVCISSIIRPWPMHSHQILLVHLHHNHLGHGLRIHHKIWLKSNYLQKHNIAKIGQQIACAKPKKMSADKQSSLKINPLKEWCIGCPIRITFAGVTRSLWYIFSKFSIDGMSNALSGSNS